MSLLQVALQMSVYHDAPVDSLIALLIQLFLSVLVTPGYVMVIEIVLMVLMRQCVVCM